MERNAVAMYINEILRNLAHRAMGDALKQDVRSFTVIH
jgi:hypothetical protein